MVFIFYKGLYVFVYLEECGIVDVSCFIVCICCDLKLKFFKFFVDLLKYLDIWEEVINEVVK